jgi:hypothetical protein
MRQGAALGGFGYDPLRDEQPEAVEDAGSAPVNSTSLLRTSRTAGPTSSAASGRSRHQPPDGNPRRSRRTSPRPGIPARGDEFSRPGRY